MTLATENEIDLPSLSEKTLMSEIAAGKEIVARDLHQTKEDLELKNVNDAVAGLSAMTVQNHADALKYIFTSPISTATIKHVVI